MTSHRERVDKLIALALDDAASENERRNASLQAVRLIDKHGMLDDQTEVDRLKKENDMLRREKSTLRTHLERVVRAIRTLEAWIPRDPEVPIAPNPTPEEVDFIRRNKAWSVGTARVVGRKCPECGQAILLGELIATPRDVGDALHLRCHQKREREKR